MTSDGRGMSLARWLVVPAAIAWAVSRTLFGGASPCADIRGDLEGLGFEAGEFVPLGGIELGRCVSGLEYRIVLPVSNPTSSPMTLDAVDMSCGCMGLEIPDSGILIGPGETLSHTGTVRVNSQDETKHWAVAYHVSSPAEGWLQIPVAAEASGAIGTGSVNGEYLAPVGSTRVPAWNRTEASFIAMFDARGLDASDIRADLVVREERFRLTAAIIDGKLTFSRADGFTPEDLPVSADLVLSATDDSSGTRVWPLTIVAPSELDSATLIGNVRVTD